MRDTGNQGCWKIGMQETRDAGKEGFRKGGMLERRNAEKEGCWKWGIQETRDAGKEGFRKEGCRTEKCSILTWSVWNWAMAIWFYIASKHSFPFRWCSSFALTFYFSAIFLWLNGKRETYFFAYMRNSENISIRTLKILDVFVSFLHTYIESVRNWSFICVDIPRRHCPIKTKF